MDWNFNSLAVGQGLLLQCLENMKKEEEEEKEEEG